ncbi:helix-turn-helix domain-containing protein [Gordonia sp. NPDC003376]
MSDHRLSPADLAEHYDVSKVTIYRLIKRGLPHLRVGTLYRFDLAETDPWMREYRTPSTADGDYREAVRRLVDEAPELSAEQADRISTILSGGQ